MIGICPWLLDAVFDQLDVFCLLLFVNLLKLQVILFRLLLSIGMTSLSSHKTLNFLARALIRLSGMASTGSIPPRSRP